MDRQLFETSHFAFLSQLKVAEEEIARHAAAGGGQGSISASDDPSAVAHMRSENARLRSQVNLAWKQVAEMKAFLNDYGMVGWVGATYHGDAGVHANSNGNNA